MNAPWQRKIPWRKILAQTLRALGLAIGALVLDYALARANVPYGPSLDGAFIVAVLAAQVGLAGVWAAIGRDFLLGRIVVLLAVSLSAWALLDNWHNLANSELVPGFWMQGVIVVGVLLIMRHLRFRLVRRGQVVLREPLDTAPQFSIRDIMIFTALVCASLATLVRLGSLSLYRDEPLISCVVGGLLAAMTLISVLSTLVLRQAVLPVSLLCGASLLLGWGIGRAIRYALAMSTLALGGPIILQVAVLLVWRQFGYRLARA